jgi:hypothetical protein
VIHTFRHGQSLGFQLDLSSPVFEHFVFITLLAWNPNTQGQWALRFAQRLGTSTLAVPRTRSRGQGSRCSRCSPRAAWREPSSPCSSPRPRPKPPSPNAHRPHGMHHGRGSRAYLLPRQVNVPLARAHVAVEDRPLRRGHIAHRGECERMLLCEDDRSARSQHGKSKPKPHSWLTPFEEWRRPRLLKRSNPKGLDLPGMAEPINENEVMIKDIDTGEMVRSQLRSLPLDRSCLSPAAVCRLHWPSLSNGSPGSPPSSVDSVLCRRPRKWIRRH